MTEKRESPDKPVIRAEEAMRMIVHDLKGPVGEIIANLDMLGSYISDEIGAEILLTALNSTEDLLDMILNILDVGKIEEGKLVLNKEKIDIVGLVKEKVDKAEGMAMRANKTIVFKSKLEKYETTGDKNILSRVFWNLISNANNHTNLGGTIEICVEVEDGRAKVTVADDGSGISPDHLDHVFDKFYQSQGPAPVKYSSGLGLTFCKMAVEAHGGGISVKSEPGKGAAFHLYIP